MTEAERTIAVAVHRHVTFCPGIPTKRFARDMAHQAEHAPERELTPKQRTYLLQVALKFRRQLPRDMVALARAEQAAEVAAC